MPTCAPPSPRTCPAPRAAGHQLGLVGSSRSGPEAMAHVGSHRVDRPFVARRARARTPLLLEPEVLVEPSPQLVAPCRGTSRTLRCRRPRGRSAPAPRTPRTRSPAPRTTRSAARASRPSANRIASQESFQPWLAKPAACGPLVLDVAVSVAVAEGLDPFERTVGVRQQLSHHLVVQTPPPQLAEQHHEQRRRVHRPVVDVAAAEQQAGCRAEPHLVHDASRLLLRRRDDVAPCSRASDSSTPDARLGSAGSAIHAVSSESRPNSVMNHGAPAAGTVRSVSGSMIRKAPRSWPARCTAATRSRLSLSTSGNRASQVS